MQKVDLRTEVMKGVGYRDVRDALKRLGHNFHQDSFGVLIWRDRISGIHSREAGRIGELNPSELFEMDEALDRNAPWMRKWPKTAAAIRGARRRSATLCKFLSNAGFIQPSQHGKRRAPKRWEITEQGSTLLAQKLLKKIPRARAVEHVFRAVHAAEQFNEEIGPNYYIARMYLFGSLLSDASEVGDVDIIVTVEWRYPDDGHEKKARREHERLQNIRPSGLRSFFASTHTEGPVRIDKLSPHVSVVSRETMIDQLKKRGEPFRLFYCHKPPFAVGAAAKAYEMDIGRARAFLRSLKDRSPAARRAGL